MSISNIKRVIFAFFAVGILFAYVPTVQAVDPKHTIKDSAYTAKYVSQSIPDPIEIEAGTTKTVIVKFKNIGTATWDSASTRFLSAYTVEPRYRASVFQGKNWIGSRETGKIEGVVKPGEIGELKIDLKAPNKTGEYTEEFYLSAENYSWVKGGYFFIKINVVPKKQVVVEVKNETPETVTENTSAFQAQRLILSKKKIDTVGGASIPVIIAFQNTGSVSWNSYAIKTTALPTDGVITASAGEAQVVVEKNILVSQGGVAREDVVLKMPQKKGTYKLAVTLSANGVDIDQELGSISVNVTENAGNIDSQSTSNQATPEVLPRLDHEPRIRVGIWKDPADGVKFMSEDDDYNIFDGGTLLGTLPRGIEAQMTYSGGVYYFSGGGINFSTGVFIRLEPKTSIQAVYRLTNYERLVSWKGPYNFNKYRGVMEYRATKSNEGVYVIEEIMFEDYIAGIAETSDASPIEYIKALLTAARTYAYYIQNSSSKHNSRFFDVVATTGDQLYLGYESERLMPHVVEAARATRGYMVTYDTDTNPDTLNDVVITPYFANTAGRTKSWTEVWGGATKPWLVSVIAQFDKRDKKRLNGHGVGMSARDAAFRADEKGESFDTLLKYYYTGVNVEKMYE